MKKFKIAAFAIAVSCLLFAGEAAAEQINLPTEYYKQGHFSIGLIDPKDEEISNHKLREMNTPLLTHVSKIDDIELAAIYLNDGYNPGSDSIWEIYRERRDAIIEATLFNDVSTASDNYVYQKLFENDFSKDGLYYKDIRYKVLISDVEYVYAVRFIRNGEEEYILIYKGPKKREAALSPDVFFNTFEIAN